MNNTITCYITQISREGLLQYLICQEKSMSWQALYDISKLKSWDTLSYSLPCIWQSRHYQ